MISDLPSDEEDLFILLHQQLCGGMCARETDKDTTNIDDNAREEETGNS